MITLHEGDNRISLRKLADNSIDSIVTDPPYALTSITKRFGKEGAAPARRDSGKGNDGSFGRVSGGFMGKFWDSTGIERDPEFWEELYRVLKPGGFVFAFSGARTGHRQAMAMETAGFVMHPMHAWLYSTGFAKGHDASKAIDKHLGTEALREVTGSAKMRDIRNDHGRGVGDGINAAGRDGPPEYLQHEYSTGGSPEASAWDGWKYGTQTQKPAMEPIYLGQKPYDGKPVESILKWGVGAFNIDGCRVPGGKNVPASVSRGKNGTSLSGSVDGSLRKETGTEPGHNPDIGRYPANLLHDRSEVVMALFPQSKGQQGDLVGHSRGRKSKHCYGDMPAARNALARGDSGSAARFFNSFPPDEAPFPLAFHHTKAGKADRSGSTHPTVKPIGLMRHLIRHITPPGGTVLDPFAGSGTTGEAARLEGMNCVLMEAEEEYLTFLRKRFDLEGPNEWADLI